jgi:predicted DsbA family dithiol-disulfide isomerase
LLDIVYHTDPICCWSWAFEAVWRRLLDDLGPAARVRYCLAGMVRDWASYDDPLQFVSRPSQMGPICVQVRHMAQVSIDDRVWVTDPPGSSWPACVAVKAAGLQGHAAEHVYLHFVRRALMARGLNIARQSVLVDAAAEVAREQPELLDVDRFRRDLDGVEAVEAFRRDLGETAVHQVGRFPTLRIRRSDGRGIVIVGYRPWQALVEAIGHVRPEAAGT